MRLLPPFDEYLISYKERSQVLDPIHQSKAFNAWGTFYPVILYEGQIIGTWKKQTSRKNSDINLEFFPGQSRPSDKQIHLAIEQYRQFLSGKQ